MCIIVDTNAFGKVFDPSNSHHSEFKPVCDWIRLADGKLVYGGSKYRREMKERCTKFLGLFKELHTARKAIEVSMDRVDNEEKRLRASIDNSDFDDPHLVAIVIVSRCRLLCTGDRRADRFVKHQRIYPQGVKPPKIYRNKKHSRLLSRANLVPCQSLLRDPSQ